ncbi:transporter substrate-binding domain-containing protein [Bordetella sp. N]|uniref:transporter substrate-binding domain-containing protein n=1 Tax=Bordetella sp. N TaxID=1746199 RepID=UPI00070B5FA9|nr:transporter substrate-binding domain-containing protein [Bordetella sp. N]ALM86249.1 amino acid ABC transporter substrate-binding protein [Bordetella sp. N]
MKSLKTMASACALLLGLAAHLAPAHADALDDIKHRGTLRVAVPQDFPPFGSVDASMQLKGLDIEVSKLIAAKLGVKVELVPVVSANRIPYLQTNKVDLVISTLGKSEEREKVIAFSQIYAPFNNSVFGRVTEKVSKPEDLAGKTIGVARGTFEDLLLTKTVPQSTVIKRYDDNNGMISAYLSGQVPLIGTGDFVASGMADTLPAGSPNKPEAKYVIHVSSCRVGLNKDEPKLLAAVNDVLTSAKKSGELNAMVEKFLHVPIPPDMLNDYK